MKKQVINFKFSRAIVLAAIAGTLSLSAIAGTTNKASKNTQSDVQYVGTTNNGVVFNVKHDNTDAGKFDLVIKNEYGEIVYQQQYSDKAFDKKIVLVKEPGDARLTFIIRSGSNTYKQSFDINTTTRTVEDVVVKSAQ